MDERVEWYESCAQRREPISETWLVSLGLFNILGAFGEYYALPFNNYLFIRVPSKPFPFHFCGYGCGIITALENKGHLIDLLNALRVKQPPSAQATPTTPQESTGTPAPAPGAAGQ